MHRRFSAAAMGAAILLLFGSAIASANYLGGGWWWNGGNTLALTYYNNTAGFPAYTAAVEDAVDTWNDTDTPISLSADYPANIIINTINDTSMGYWGVGREVAMFTACGLCLPLPQEIPYKDCANPCSLGAGWGSYVWSDITLNRKYSGFSADLKQKVAAHEIGHALGLGHTSCVAVMKQGDNGYSGPTAYDQHELKRLYPSYRSNPQAICGFILVF